MIVVSSRPLIVNNNVGVTFSQLLDLPNRFTVNTYANGFYGNSQNVEQINEFLHPVSHGQNVL